MPVWVWMYNLLLTIAAVLAGTVMLPLVLAREKRRRTVLQRLTISGLPASGDRPAGKPAPIWVHALSVGEVTSAVPLVEAVRRRCPGIPVVVSVSTLSGYDLARRVMAGRIAALFFFPYDGLICVRRALSRMAPQLIMIVESDIWPNFILSARQRKIPVFLVNARLSERSFKGYRRVRYFMAPVLNTLNGIGVQGQVDARRYRDIGVDDRRITITGSTKFDVDLSPMTESQRRDLRQSLGLEMSAPVILAGSTHDGEEAIILSACRQAANRHPRLRLVVAPRDPMRWERVSGVCHRFGFRPVRLADLEQDPSKASDAVIIIDRIGMLAGLYAAADIAVIGGSFADQGGHNPLEPAAQGVPVVFGPDMNDFRDAARLLLAAGGALQADDGPSLTAVLLRLLDQPELANERGRQALDVFRNQRGAATRTLNMVVQKAGASSAGAHDGGVAPETTVTGSC